MERQVKRARQVKRPRSVGPVRGNALIVDDDDGVRFVLHRALSSLGWKVSDLSDGSDVETRLRRERYDLILLDLYMPGMNGFEVIRRLRKQDPMLLPVWKTPPTVKVLVISGANVEGLEFARRVGADDYLPKPFELTDVLEAVKRLTPAPSH